MLAADEYYGVQERFSRVADFGFSKSAEETFAKWGGHDVALGDMVRVIRTFRPDVLVARFSGTDRDGHGHHQASSILTQEAFRAAADPKRFPSRSHAVDLRRPRLRRHRVADSREQGQPQRNAAGGAIGGQAGARPAPGRQRARVERAIDQLGQTAVHGQRGGGSLGRLVRRGLGANPANPGARPLHLMRGQLARPRIGA